MPILWQRYLETGVLLIDKQHRELFDRLNKLLEAMTKSRGREEVQNLFTFLDSYVIFHFGAEEKYMEASSFEDMERHSAEHEKFRKDIARFRKEFDSGVDLQSLLNTQDYLTDWLINHIGNMDRDLGVHLKKKGLA